jgi:hypothetical protein
MIYMMTTTQSLRLSQSAKRQRYLLLALTLIPLVISLLNRWGIRIALWGCPTLKWVGVPCMGWGLTRSFHATVRGDLATAMQFHLFGPLFVLGAVVAVVHAAIELIRNQKLQLFYSPWIIKQRFWLLAIAVVFGYHVTRVVSLSQQGQLSQWMAQSIVGQWF